MGSKPETIAFQEISPVNFRMHKVMMHEFIVGPLPFGTLVVEVISWLVNLPPPPTCIPSPEIRVE